MGATRPASVKTQYSHTKPRNSANEYTTHFTTMTQTASISIVTLSAANINSVPNRDTLVNAFVALNKEWITRYFRLEPSDLHYFSNPVEQIITPGGYIFVALANGTPIGCCALIPHNGPHPWELAKMAVSPGAQGHGAGLHLGQTALAQAWRMGAKEVFLEANTKLEASVHLYNKLGFEAVADYVPAYDRCNLYMICKQTKNTHS